MYSSDFSLYGRKALGYYKNNKGTIHLNQIKQYCLDVSTDEFLLDGIIWTDFHEFLHYFSASNHLKLPIDRCFPSSEETIFFFIGDEDLCQREETA